jgi:hypothetical protein
MLLLGSFTCLLNNPQKSPWVCNGRQGLRPTSSRVEASRPGMRPLQGLSTRLSVAAMASCVMCVMWVVQAVGPAIPKVLLH